MMRVYPCEYCGKDIHHRRKKYCNRACMAEAFAIKKTHTFLGPGRRLMPKGYITVRLPKNHPMQALAFAPGRAVLEHRLVMSEHLGRLLHPNETVHHKNGDRTDNRIENLELRIGGHGQGQAWCCADCGSRRLRPLELASKDS